MVAFHISQSNILTRDLYFFSSMTFGYYLQNDIELDLTQIESVSQQAAVQSPAL